MKAPKFKSLKDLKNLKLMLTQIYPSISTNITPAYYRNKKERYSYFSSDRYSDTKIYFYLFLVFLSHNTSDLVTNKTFEKVLLKLEKEPQVDPEFFKVYYYKHKERYLQALVNCYNIVKSSLKKDTVPELKELLKVKGVGFKSAALILNHFFGGPKLPVVDVNVQKAFNLLFETNLSMNDIYLTLLLHEKQEKEPQLAHLIANLLWTHRKTCRLKKCTLTSTSSNQCSTCKYLKSKILEL